MGQVLSHWTWLPALSRQFEKSGQRFLNAGNRAVMRLITPLGMRYGESYQKAFPFDAPVDGMQSSRMIEESVAIMLRAVEQGARIYVSINNRAGGNAPMIAQQLALALPPTSRPRPPAPH